MFGLVWVLMITSARHAPWPGDITITDLTATGLAHPSLIRTAKIATIDSRLVDTIGHLSLSDRRTVTACLQRQLEAALSR
jgi:mRNA interferase MazF